MDIQGWVTPAVFSQIHYLQHRKRQTDVCILPEKRQVYTSYHEKDFNSDCLYQYQFGGQLTL